MGLVGRAVEHLRADQIGGLLREFLRKENSKTECGMARIGECKVGLDRGLAVPHREYAEVVGEILDLDLGAQFVEAELVGKSLRERPWAIDQKTTAVAGRRLGDQKIHRYLALGRQQRAESPETRPEQGNVRGDEAVEEVAGVAACDLDHA